MLSTPETRHRFAPRLTIVLFSVLAVGLLSTTWVLSLAVPTQTKEAAFRALGVPALPDSFTDLRIVWAWLDCYRAGEDLSVGCSSAPAKQPLLYPRTWLLLAGTGLGAKDTKWTAAAVEFTFFVSLLLLVRGKRLEEIWPLLVVLPSPPIWLALERCNADLLIFPAVVGLAFVGELGAFAIICGMLALKFYPVGAAAVFLNNRIKITAGWLAASSTALILFLLCPLAGLRGVGRLAGIYYSSLGWGVLPVLLNEKLAARGIRILPAMQRTAFVMMVLVILGGVAFSRVNYLKPVWSGRERRWLQASLGLYATCFALGYNYDYRYIFLLPAFPAIGVAIGQKGWRSVEGFLGILCILMLWLTWDQHGKTVLLQAMMQWAVLGLSVPMLLWSRDVKVLKH